MALRAATFVGWHSDAEIVQQVSFAEILAFEAGDVGCDTSPREVRLGQHVLPHQAVAVQARLRARVLVIGKVAGMQLLHFVGAARNRVAVERVDHVVAIEVFPGVRHAVTVKVPASEAVRAIQTVNTICARCAVVAFTTGDRKSEEHAGRKARKAEFTARSPSHFWSPQFK